MKQQQAFLNSLLDFSNVPSKRTDHQHSHSGLLSQFSKTQNTPNKKTNTERPPHQILTQIDDNLSLTDNEKVFTGNQKLLITWNRLREKLSQSGQQNISLKSEIDLLSNEVGQFRQKQKHFISQIKLLNKKCNFSQQQSSQYKARLHAMKQDTQIDQQKSEEITHLKLSFQRVMQQNKRLKQESLMSMQISIQQKLDLQQDIQTFKMKQISTGQLCQQMQSQLLAKNKQLLKLDNEFKKLKITFQEEQYSKNNDAQTVILRKEYQDLLIRNQDLQTKLKKEKNKKYQLQNKLLQLQQKVRLYGTKTDIYEGELSTIAKKMKKVQRDQIQSKKQATEALNQRLSWEEKFYNSTIICEQLISRVKRQLKGDAVELAKTCEFRLSKIKNDEKLDICAKPLTKRPRSQSCKKIRPQTQKYAQNINDDQFEKNEQEILTVTQNKLNHAMNKAQNQSNHYAKGQQNHSKTVLKEKNIYNQANGIENVKKRLFNQLQTPAKVGYANDGNNLRLKSCSNGKFHVSQLNSNDGGQLNLEAKIRKQRELMQRKLRQKILYHKIEDATSQPLRNKLRDQYFTLNAMEFC